MINKNVTKAGCLVLAGILAVSVGCTAQKKPLPKKNINISNRSSVYPRAYPRGGMLGVPGPNMRYVAPIPPVQTMGMSLEQKMAQQAKSVNGVNDASVLLIGKTAFVGIDLKKDIVGKNTSKIKKLVADKLKANPQVNTVMVTADPDLLQRIRDIISGKATPNVIGDLYKRMKMEK